MDDLISRQAAISAICNACGKIDCDKMDKCEKLQLPPANCSEIPNNSDTISRQAAIDVLKGLPTWWADGGGYYGGAQPPMVALLDPEDAVSAIENLPPAQPDLGKYEYHYDHTDCIWYRPEARNRCPATCAQYRDGWNDAMNYIFRDGEGYRPFRRDKKYEG